MGIPSILYLFLLLHLLFLHSSGKCPDSFNCGTHGQRIRFPLSNTTFPQCGLYTVQNCADPVPTLKWGPEESLVYDLKSANVQQNSIRVNDRKLENLIRTNGCDIFSLYMESTLPNKSSVNFTISPGLTLFKCTTTSPELDKQQAVFFRGNDSYRGCSGYTVYYTSPRHYQVQSYGNLPPNCSVIELPAVSELGNRNSSDLFSLLASEFSIEFHPSEECSDCRHNGGRCGQDGTHFSCRKEKEVRVTGAKGSTTAHKLLVQKSGSLRETERLDDGTCFEARYYVAFQKQYSPPPFGVHRVDSESVRGYNEARSI